MARVKIVSSVRVGQRRLPVKQVKSIASVLVDAQIEATTTQMRVLAEETRELVIDKVMAARPQGMFVKFQGRKVLRRGQAKVNRPPRLRRPDILTVDRIPLPHKRLKRATVLAKLRRDEDTRPFIATGDLIRHIEVFRGEEGAVVYYMVRPTPGRHKPSGLTYRRIWRLNEFGSRAANIPPRPTWRPVILLVGHEFRRLGPRVRAVPLRTALRRIR